jgi:nucleotide-binding universal stress UspA family protein
MTLKDIMVTVDTREPNKTRVELAARIASQFQAHLIGFHAFGLGEMLAPVNFTPGFQLALDEVISAAEGRAAECRQVFEDVVQRQGLAWEWRSVRGLPSDEASVHGRYVDLTIIGQIDPDESGVLQPAPEEVALRSGRPVLVVPYAGRFEQIGRHALVAWDAGREAARAVNDALPFLKRAASVTIMAINPKSRPGGHGDEPGADIALHLVRHGVKAQVEQNINPELDVANILLSSAADLGADLIVMGAYGHSRTRELLLGGTTRAILEQMTVPVFLSH